MVPGEARPVVYSVEPGEARPVVYSAEPGCHLASPGRAGSRKLFGPKFMPGYQSVSKTGN